MGEAEAENHVYICLLFKSSAREVFASSVTTLCSPLANVVLTVVVIAAALSTPAEEPLILPSLESPRKPRVSTPIFKFKGSNKLVISSLTA